jgi:hypothetical protein
MSPKGKEKEKTIISINEQLFAHSTHTVFFSVKHSQARESGFKLEKKRNTRPSSARFLDPDTRSLGICL